ncbi:PQQ-binding-like beta-propeller repeat protein [Moritella marina ATCC 15381]|uniref:PQQ-binding-like beta-propeller repeat protein n=1 Tax=Moritella marina ATCC 15381 TaxID=1202962 RepID=A0A5J6WG82_MORMI|nr:PQQ-binding-like beta-propeller repeat protein [Moritella marina]QFI36989.1 PQQ-binding-like beta-propeller repeat protein [Moritella marina ATCC 15381]
MDTNTTFRFTVLSAAITLSTLLAGCSMINTDAQPKDMPEYKLTDWKPVGVPNAGPMSDTVPVLNTFHTMHGSINNTDQLMIVTAPEQKLSWVAETQFYVPEGPSLDQQGNLYFSPFRPNEDVSLVALDGKTGERRWTLPAHGDISGSGATLILNSPEHNQEVIYHSTYQNIWAVTTDGDILWTKKTGLTWDLEESGSPHAWGVNFVPGLNALSLVTGNGKIMLFDRLTGRQLLAEAFDLPGSPAVQNLDARPPKFVRSWADEAAEEQFGKSQADTGLFTTITDIIFGGGREVTNFYASDPISNRLYVAATAPDEIDGTKDDVSELGALYALDIVATTAGQYKLDIAGRFDFDGGTGATPSVSNDGQKIFTTDDHGNIIALARDLTEIWRVNVGQQIAASPAIGSDNGEIYAITMHKIVKVQDNGDSGELVWDADIDMFPDFNSINALTPTITANGVAVSIGAVKSYGSVDLMVGVGLGLLDKDTGKMISFVEAAEESIAVTVVAPDGGFAIGHSPTRRLAAKGILGDNADDIIGGVARYVPTNPEFVARDAVCMAVRYTERQQSYSKIDNAQAYEWDTKQINVLVNQAENALGREVDDLAQECEALTTKLDKVDNSAA